MRKENMKENYTTILLPKGEWLQALIEAFKVANLGLVAEPRSYEYSFINQTLPILFQAVRSKEVPDLVYDWDISANAGFTGSDIAAEQRVDTKGSRIWEFPLQKLNPNAPQPKVYLGTTPRLREQIATPALKDIDGTTIYTEYPVITQAFLADNKLEARVKSLQGGTEGRWRLDSRNGAVVTIRNTDTTLRANGIEPLVDIMAARVLCMESPALSDQDKLRVDDLRELLYIVTQSE